MDSTTKQFKFSQVIQGYLYNLQARHLSPHTVLDYENTIRKFSDFLKDDIPFCEITQRHVEGFLISQSGLTNKTLLNYYVGLSAVWTWAVREHYTDEHVVHAVTRPKPEQHQIVPYTKEEIKAMLNSLRRTRVYQRPGQRPTDHSIPFGSPERNRAIILLLIDTAIRADELCQAKIYDLDKRNQRLHVVGKGAKERYVPFSAITGQAIWRYIATRGTELNPAEPLFVTKDRRSLTRDQLLDRLQTIGERAGVPGVTVHRFRHTAAIQYLRNGGDPYTLQRLLGHSTLDTVKLYLSIAQVDIDDVHKRASPVDNWRL